MFPSPNRTPMSKKLWDAIIVGGGPAGITAALRLARQDLDVLVVEAAVYPGAENWSGAVYFAEKLADPSVMGETALEAAPFERRVVKRGFFSCNGLTLAGAEYRNPETFRHCYTVLRPVYDRYLAEHARSLGVTLLNETTADGLIHQGGRVIGVHTTRGPIYGDIVYLAEGDASHLVSKEGFERDAVRAKPSGQPAFLQGVKEVIELSAETIEQRFGVGPGEAACYEVLLRNGAIDGKPVRLNMAGFIYTNRSSVSIGLVLPLDNLAGFGGDYNDLMEWYKSLPPIQRLIAGGESTSYGAKIIRAGGLRELPKLVDNGVAIGGAATGIGVDFPYPNFTGPACAMGALFAEAVLALRKAGGKPTRERLEQLYVEPLKASNYYRDVEHLRDWPAFIEHSDALFGQQIDLLNGSLYAMTRPQLGFARKWWETVRLVAETLKGRWVQTLRDLSGGSQALGLGRFALKHALPALLLSIPNTIIALLPFAWGRGPGEMKFSLWVKDEEAGRLPWFKRWLGARYTPALAKAADVLYANDGVPIARKLDRCVGIVLRRLSLWELAGALIGFVSFLLTRAAQRLRPAAKPTQDPLRPSFYAQWLAGWRALTDLSPGRIGHAKTHDAKLGEITYTSEPGSHIKVFFPPEAPGVLEDPSKSALWSVCPAAVYQINVDRTAHASVTVNFENCVKCETCWRIEPQHVDWSRFGEHRLVYEVYTEADRALNRIIAERTLSTPPQISTSFWEAKLSSAFPGDIFAREGADVGDAIAAARRAIRVAEAKCSQLHDDVWLGPRVLEAGQVGWYRAAIEYFADLAEEAASVALAEPIESWLVANELNAVHVELLQLRRDLEKLTAKLRDHAEIRHFFAAEADARQIRSHHLAGIRACVDLIAEACLCAEEASDPVTELRDIELPSAEREAARHAWRDQLAAVFDRQALRRLEHGGVLEEGEVEVLRAAARAALGVSDASTGFNAWDHLTRTDLLAELARVDSSLAALLSTHLACVDTLARAGARGRDFDELKSARRFGALAFEAEAEAGDAGWHARLPFVFMGLAELIVARGGGRLGLFNRDAADVRTKSTAPIGLIGAAVSQIDLEGARPVWVGHWSAADESAVFASRARDVAAIALGASGILTERAIDHARSRIQFPDMFQDGDGRDAVAKFGAVRAHLSHIEAARLAIETLLQDIPWSDADTGLEALVGKVAVTDLFGPDLPSITYRAGQVIGGTAFSEDDIFSKVYRDSSVFPHLIRENALLNVEIGRPLAGGEGSLIGMISANTRDALNAMERRPILDFEVRRLRAAEQQLAAAMRSALKRGVDHNIAQVVHDIVGELATRLYVWARLLIRAHRRLEGALSAQRHVEAAQLWADTIEERLIALDQELQCAAARVELGSYAFQLDGYPDTPIATTDLDFNYARDIIEAKRGYRSGQFLLKPLDLEEARYLPELLWADDVTRAHYEEYLDRFRQRFVEGDFDPSFERHVERLHYIPREDIDWTRDEGHFRVVIPTEYGGQGRSKADYYSLCMISKRLADISHTLTIQANTSIGTTPILIGLFQDVAVAERDLQQVVERAEAIEQIKAGIQRLLAERANADVKALEQAYLALNKEVGGLLGRSRILKKVVFGRFLSQMQKAGAAGMKQDLDGFFGGLEKALAGLEGWRERSEAELDEMPRRRLAHEFYLRLISARMISAFALTEPSAGSDTARIRTEARLDFRKLHTDPDGVKYFFLDEKLREGRRNIADMRRFEFDGPKILYRYSDAAEPAEILSQEYTYEEGEEKYRYFVLGERRIDIHDMALIRERDGEEYYDFYVLNGAKMWITNGHIAGVEAVYARTPAGVTGFMVDALTEGFLVGKDEEKTGQRGSPTNEITLTNVRVPRECILGIEGRGQENALETLNVGRTGLCISSATGIQQAIGDACDYLAQLPRGSQGWARYRLGLALEEMFAIETIAYNIIGLYDDGTSDALRMESSVGKYFGTEGLHRMLHYLEPVYCIDGQTQLFRIEKDRRDARVMTIYEGTNEIQQFLLLKDLIDMIGPQLDKLEGFKVEASDTPYANEVRILGEMLAALHERLSLSRKTYKSAAWQRVLLQPTFFRLARMASLVKMVDSAVHRANWIARHLTGEGDGLRKAWSERAARGFVARANREFTRLARGFDRDFDTLRSGGRPIELRLAETVLDEADAAQSAQSHQPPAEGIARSPIERDLRIVVAVEQTPRLAPRPRLANGHIAEHVYAFSSGDRRALRLALAIKRSAPARVQVTLVTAANLAAEDHLRFGLAAGADRALLLDTRGQDYSDYTIAETLAATLRQRNIAFDLLLASGSADSPSDGRLALHLAGELATQWVPGVTDLWVQQSAAICASQRFPEPLRMPLPCVVAVTAAEAEPEWVFTTTEFSASLHKPIEVIAFPPDAERSHEEFATAAAAAATDTGDRQGSVAPERAADLLLEAGDLGDGTGAPTGVPFVGAVRDVGAESLDWAGVLFVAELEEGDLAKNARAPLAAAQSIAGRGGLSLSCLVLTESLDEARLRSVAGQLLAAAPFSRIVFAQNQALGSGAQRAYAEALIRLLGPGASSRPSYLLSSPWLSEALPVLSGALREAKLDAEELAGVNRIEFRNGEGIAFVRPVHARKLRAKRLLPAKGNGIRLIWCEPGVAATAAEVTAGETEVVRVDLQLEYDPQTDALARALAEAKQTLGVVTLENAEFIIDVGAGLRSVDSLETVVEPLKNALLELGAPHVEIGATRKVTMDLSWLPDERQIGQTGIRVNPRIMIALGVSGAPQHIDYVGDRTVIFAFNLDAQAPLMTLNERREQPKVYPVVGDLFKTVPKFVEALRRRSERSG